MKKLLTAAFIVMLMACICIGGALFVQAQDGSGTPQPHAHNNWSYDYDTNIATCNEANCGVTCNHEGTLTVTNLGTAAAKHALSCSVCGYTEAEESCYGGTAADCTHLPECVVCKHPYGDVYGTVHTGVLVYEGPHEENPERYHVMRYTCCKRTVDVEHTPGAAATCQSGTSCAVCGSEYNTATDPNNHDASEPTYAPLNETHHKIICKCGVELGTVAHSGGTATCSKQANCEHCGMAYGALTEHVYKNDCDTDCNVCGATRAPKAHTFGEWETTKQPTETEEGEKKRVCTVCGEIETEAISIAEPDGMKTSTLVIIIVAAVLVVAGGAVAAVLLIKKKKTDATQEAEEAEVVEEAEVTESTEETETAEAPEATETAEAPEAAEPKKQRKPRKAAKATEEAEATEKKKDEE